MKIPSPIITLFKKPLPDVGVVDVPETLNLVVSRVGDGSHETRMFVDFVEHYNCTYYRAQIYSPGVDNINDYLRRLRSTHSPEVPIAEK